MKFQVGDTIEVIDKVVSDFPVRGEVLEVDYHPLDQSFIKLRLQSPVLPPPEIWVNSRLAKKL